MVGYTRRWTVTPLHFAHIHFNVKGVGNNGYVLRVVFIRDNADCYYLPYIRDFSQKVRQHKK